MLTRSWTYLLILIQSASYRGKIPKTVLLLARLVVLAITFVDISIYTRGRRVIGISGSLIWSQTLMELIFNPCCEFREVRRAQLAKSILLTSPLVPLGSFQIFKVCSDVKERVGCGKQREATAPIHP